MISQERIQRRQFIKMAGTSTFALSPGLIGATPSQSPLRIGLITDIHYADLPTAGTRHYRDSIEKVREAVKAFNTAAPDMVIFLGDLIDTGSTVEKEYGHLETIYRELSQLEMPIRFVLGNHCVWTLTKSEFLKGVRQKRSFDAIELKGTRLVMLDACHRKDGVSYGRQNYVWTDTEIPKNQRDWLRTTLSESSQPTLVFVHQRLDVEGNHGVHSAPEVRRILEKSGQVAAVFQGHSHDNDHRQIKGSHYLTMRAVIEGPASQHNAYALLEFDPAGGRMTIDGRRDQKDYQWMPPA